MAPVSEEADQDQQTGEVVELGKINLRPEKAAMVGVMEAIGECDVIKGDKVAHSSCNVGGTVISTRKR